MTRHLQLALSLVAVAVLSGCDMFGFHEWQWRQKLTVTVNTPDGLRTGSAVTDVRVYASPRWWGVGDAAGSGGSTLSGEAVTVDLGGGRYLFALLEDYDFETARKTFIPTDEQPRTEAQAVEVYDRLEKMRGSRALPHDQYPLLVTFDDIGDPTTVKIVEPSNFAAAFGPGYSLGSISMAVTQESATDGRVQSVLGWLINVGNERFYLHPNTPRLLKDFTPEQRLKPSDFLSIDHWRK